MSAIRRLPEALVREIAAGEVVRGPADALRELLDNALDAGAGRIEVELDGGGLERLLVRDDGAGIPFDDLPLAVEPHCTSKGAPLDRVATLGFRGEGLHALRRAGRLRLLSRPADQLGGGELVARDDEVALEPVPAPAGTTAELTRLFERMPARRRALGGAAAEGRACLEWLHRVVLHRPELELRATLDGVPRLLHPGGGPVDAVRLVWGTAAAHRVIAVDAREDAGGGAERRLRGAVSRPELVRARRDRLHLAVDGRPVAWPAALEGAVREAYGTLLPDGRWPLAALSLELPPGEAIVDPGPRKGEVRLADEAATAAFVAAAVREALAGHPLAAPLPLPSPVGPEAGAAPGGVEPAPRGAFPRLRPLGAFRELYLLAEGDGALWVVDQHAAHERVLFEELERRWRAEPPFEPAAPELIELSAAEEARWLGAREALAERGVELEPFGGGRWRVRRAPAFLAGTPGLVGDVVRAALAGDDLERAWRALLGRWACLPAVKAGHRLATADAAALLDALAACETPWSCPHGRPTALVLRELELARRFGRRGVRATERERT